MPTSGPDREVTDERVLLEFILTADPAMFASEVADNLPVSRQRVTTLLDDMENDDGWVTSKHASGRRLWWLTPTGRKQAAEELRMRLD